VTWRDVVEAALRCGFRSMGSIEEVECLPKAVFRFGIAQKLRRCTFTSWGVGAAAALPSSRQ
jgi:hypothetical protein